LIITGDGNIVVLHLLEEKERVPPHLAHDVQAGLILLRMVAITYLFALYVEGYNKYGKIQTPQQK
jgi:hypothetical protein